MRFARVPCIAFRTFPIHPHQYIFYFKDPIDFVSKKIILLIIRIEVPTERDRRKQKRNGAKIENYNKTPLKHEN